MIVFVLSPFFVLAIEFTRTKWAACGPAWGLTLLLLAQSSVTSNRNIRFAVGLCSC